ncbi:hypothetical protein [Paenibacillus aquistagni]|uniref:hypothetical protein n=1 Tax=Paenibacillus aquistagni TaxID=1852522 RepID=UPI000B508572|nr:hypothetical protein [Paenibacillus aquistagni]NMM54882.1 hypothetical protein [Paenibacillus aquistagni]
MMDMNSKSQGNFTACCLNEVNASLNTGDDLRQQQTAWIRAYGRRLCANMLSGLNADRDWMI